MIKCPECGGPLFENYGGDFQCYECGYVVSAYETRRTLLMIKCPECGGPLFENDSGDFQCHECGYVV